jgi:RNA polymerase subunit RPABC4/transcription elongation factor Spt4
MSAFDKREDWALPGAECWVAEDDGSWHKGRVVSFAGGGYVVIIEGEKSRTAKRREHQIRPRDMYNYGKDKPEPLCAGKDRRA